MHQKKKWKNEEKKIEMQIRKHEKHAVNSFLSIVFTTAQFRVFRILWSYFCVASFRFWETCLGCCQYALYQFIWCCILPTMTVACTRTVNIFLKFSFFLFIFFSFVGLHLTFVRICVWLYICYLLFFGFLYFLIALHFSAHAWPSIWLAPFWTSISKWKELTFYRRCWMQMHLHTEVITIGQSIRAIFFHLFFSFSCSSSVFTYFLWFQIWLWGCVSKWSRFKFNDTNFVQLLFGYCLWNWIFMFLCTNQWLYFRTDMNSNKMKYAFCLRCIRNATTILTNHNYINTIRDAMRWRICVSVFRR